MSIDFDIKRKFDIGERKVFVIDSALEPSELKMVQALAGRTRFQRSEYDRENTRHRSLIAEIDIDRLGHAAFIEKILDITRTLFPDPPLMIDRIHVNNNIYGDMAYPHRDGVALGETVTAMLYVHKHWEYDWGGETLFYDELQDAVACVSPKPGRLVVFNGMIEHKGSIPSRECYEDRLTIVIKLGPCS